ncbi:hypothetical protein P691DRAFT_471600 [Macrolepiota fuliginosa MF-IS2]|uniref:Uncharacterized protein n=1 Tax=Macrolepiota fuliginosa MF-IS2 TaxID=1400762 RepID=A0A9P6C3Q6_9AGAR|nr:hypothetical protein P691DRAFT_471600 [Macrolepiota fuliginosa MF-IS2]
MEDPEATIKLVRQEGGQHELPERRTTLALGEANREPVDSLLPKRAATMDDRGRGDQAPPVALPQKHDAYPALQHSDGDHRAKGLGHDDSMDSYVRKIVNQFDDNPKFPEPLADPNGTAPSFPEPQPHLHATAMAVEVPEPHIPSLPQRGYETSSSSIPTAISFPIPSLDTSWNSYHSPANHAIQASGDLSTSDLPHLQHTLIAGTNLQFEPFPSPYERVNLDDSPRKNAGAHPPMDTSTSEDPPSSSVNVPPSSPLGQEGPAEGHRGGISNHNTIIVDTKSNGVANPAIGIAPTAPLRISKHTRTPSSPGIPPGAAPPTPPSPSWSVSSKRGRQSTSARASLPLPVTVCTSAYSFAETAKARSQEKYES